MLKKLGIVGVIGSAITGSYFLYNYYQQKNKTIKKKVLLIGHGYAGRAFSNNLDKSKYDLSIIVNEIQNISQPDYIDNLETNNIKIIRNDNVLIESVKTILPDKKLVITDKMHHTYDYLILALGHENNTFNIEGVKEYCQFFSSCEDLEKVRVLSTKPNQRIAIIGANVGGIEIASYLSMMHTVDVIECGSKILPTMKPDTRGSIYNRLINEQQINFKFGTKLTKVTENETNQKIAHTQNLRNNFNESTEYDIIIWTAGTMPKQIVNELLHVPVIKVDDKMKIIDYPHENIFAIGDCNGTYERSAQSAKSQGRFLAKLFNSDFDSNNHYKYKSLGTFVKLPNCYYLESDYYSGYIPRPPRNSNIVF